MKNMALTPRSSLQKLHENQAHMSDMETFDPSTDTWSPGVSMSTARAKAACVQLEGKIYVIGGFDGTTRLASM